MGGTRIADDKAMLFIWYHNSSAASGIVVLGQLHPQAEERVEALFN